MKDDKMLEDGEKKVNSWNSNIQFRRLLATKFLNFITFYSNEIMVLFVKMLALFQKVMHEDESAY